jgi:U3 small nucleolar RNA-associated protein 20
MAPPSDELRTTAVELQELLQSKAGSAQFADVYNRIRQGVLGVRRERRTNRVLMVSITSLKSMVETDACVDVHSA